jgi:hypothetical protein
MKIGIVLLCGLALLAPALAQDRGTEFTPTTPQTPVASTQYRYAPDVQLMVDGSYRAEVRRRDTVTGRVDIAWSSAPYVTKTDAMREACTTIRTIYDPNRFCPPALQQPSIAAGAADFKKVSSGPNAHKPLAQRAADPGTQSKRTTARRPAESALSGYEVPGCAFYSLDGTRVVQHCPSADAPGTRPFWYFDMAYPYFQ